MRSQLSLFVLLLVALAATLPASGQPGWLQPGSVIMANPSHDPSDSHPAEVVRYNADSETYLIRFISGPYAIGNAQMVLSASRLKPAPAGTAVTETNPLYQKANLPAAIPPAQPPAAAQAPEPVQPTTTPERDKSGWNAMQKDIEERIAATKQPPKPVGKVGGSTPFSGLYLRHEQSFNGTSLNYREDHYFFFPDGRVYHGVPPEGPSRFDWNAELKKNPTLCGYYGVNGQNITFSWPGGGYTWILKKNGGGYEMNYSPTVKVDQFPANARLSGTYQVGSITAAPGLPTLASATTYTFRPDGTVSLSGMGGTNTTTVTTTVREQDSGTYTLSGNDLEIRCGGQTWRCTAFPQWEKGGGPSQTPPRISINGALHERRR